MLYLYENFTAICSEGANWIESSISSNVDLVPAMPLAIIWSNDDPIYKRHSASIIYLRRDTNRVMILNTIPLPKFGL